MGEQPKLDGRYPFVYHDRKTWGRVGVSLAVGADSIRLDMLRENRPSGEWQVINLTGDEAEQLGLRLLERVATLRGTPPASSEEG